MILTQFQKRQKDVERLGKEVLKEVYEFLHDEYILNNFSEMKLEKQKFLRDLVHFKFRRDNYTLKQEGKSWKVEYENFDESKYEEELKSIINEIENKSLDIQLVFTVLNSLNLDEEIDGDLFFKKDAFINIFKVFDMNYSYL